MTDDKKEGGPDEKTTAGAVFSAIGALHRLGAGITMLAFAAFVYWQSSDASKTRLLDAILSGEGAAGWLWTGVFLLCVVDMVVGASAWLRRRLTEARRVRQLRGDKARLERVNLELTRQLADTRMELRQTQHQLDLVLSEQSERLTFPEERAAEAPEPAVHEDTPTKRGD